MVGWFVVGGEYRRAAAAAGWECGGSRYLGAGAHGGKVRTQPGGDLGCSSPQRKPGGHPTLAGALSIHLPGQDRRGNLGALPGVRTAGYHASRFALASRNLQPGASILTGY